MEFYICWKMVSSDCMIRVETILMDELNQNNNLLVEPHLYPWQCRTQQIELVNTDVVPLMILFWLDLCTIFVSILNM